MCYHDCRDYVDNDYSGIPSSLTFSPNDLKSCFNVSFPDDTEYEVDEAVKISVSPSSDGIEPGSVPETDVIIADDDGNNNNCVVWLTVTNVIPNCSSNDRWTTRKSV